MKIGDRIKTLREAKGLQQLELCAILDIEQSTLANYESGRRIPNDEIKIKIANYFDVSLDYLLGRDNQQVYNTPADIKRILSEQVVMFDGEAVTESNKAIIKQMLTAMNEVQRQKKMKK